MSLVQVSLFQVFVNILKGQLYKCEKLFDKGASELVIHGLGAAVYKAANLALRLKEIHHETLDLDVRTSTVALVGTYTFLCVYVIKLIPSSRSILLIAEKLEALSDDVDDEINNRQNSAIHIRLVRRVPVAVLRSK